MADDSENTKCQTPVTVKPGLELPSVSAGERQAKANAEPVAPEAGESAGQAVELKGAAQKSAPAKAANVGPGPTAKARRMKPHKGAQSKSKPRETAQPEAAAPKRPDVAKRAEPVRPKTVGRTAAPSLAAFGEEAIVACTESGVRAAKGLETLSKEILTFGRSTIDANFLQARALLAARSLNEAFALQSDFTGRQIDALVGEAAKLGRLGTTAAQEALAPLKAQADAATRRFGRSKAA